MGNPFLTTWKILGMVRLNNAPMNESRVVRTKVRANSSQKARRAFMEDAWVNGYLITDIKSVHEQPAGEGPTL